MTVTRSRLRNLSKVYELSIYYLPEAGVRPVLFFCSDCVKATEAYYNPPRPVSFYLLSWGHSGYIPLHFWLFLLAVG